jgi:uncharacterized protein YyaL (SSP411 family)
MSQNRSHVKGEILPHRPPSGGLAAGSGTPAVPSPPVPPPPLNRLAGASSPYLVAHAADPVDWWQWGPPALAEARSRRVPILLSIGYSACHWCHVMHRESFADPATAERMNRWFVNIKVDREERPDLDRVYLDAAQALGGSGGWPLTVFLTPEGEPFFAGTYFPPAPRHGLPAFGNVLAEVHRVWETRRDEVTEAGAGLARRLAEPLPPAATAPGPEVLITVYRALEDAYDPVNGGFGGPPKFPQASSLEFLLRAAGASWAPRAADMARHTLEAMARGGIHDQVGGGFARYSVDERWLVPHFEKMLYDNALLGRLYARAGQVTGDPFLGEVARRTLDYLLADLALPEGGFASSEDADSEGEEGRFYTFSYQDFYAAAGPAASLAAPALGVTPEGDFAGSSILHRPRTPAQVAADAGVDPAEVERAVAAALSGLAARRARRPRPARDDKVITAWNGLAIRALAEAGTILPEPRYVEAAEKAAAFAVGTLRRPDGRLHRSVRGSRAGVPGFCDDYAALALGLFALYRASGNPSWFHTAATLVDEMTRLFRDPLTGVFFATGDDAEQLIARPLDLADHPTPSDNALAAEALLTLGAYRGDDATRTAAEGIFKGAGRILESAPLAAGHLAAVLLAALAPPRELAVVGPPDHPTTRALLTVAEDSFRPAVFLARGDGVDSGGVPLLEGRTLTDGGPTAYLCRHFTCQAPTSSPDVLRSMLGGQFAFSPAGRRVPP